jgi:hypothetical protein
MSSTSFQTFLLSGTQAITSIGSYVSEPAKKIFTNPTAQKVAAVAAITIAAGSALYYTVRAATKKPEVANKEAILPPEKVEKKEIKKNEETHKLRFEKAAENFLKASLDTKAYTLSSYQRFIDQQSTSNHLVPKEEMHRIFAEKFNTMHASSYTYCVEQLSDHSTIVSEAQRRVSQERERERESYLKEKDQLLAGQKRFNGQIHAAWSEYFTEQKNYIKALAPLCRFIRGMSTELSKHEMNTLTFTLQDPSSKQGCEELKKMEKGLKGLATYTEVTKEYNQDITLQDLLSYAKSFQGADTYIQAVIEAKQKVDEAFEIYSFLDNERATIAGRFVNPQKESPEQDSELAKISFEMANIQGEVDRIVGERNEKIKLLTAMKNEQALQALMQTAIDSRRI